VASDPSKPKRAVWAAIFILTAISTPACKQSDEAPARPSEVAPAFETKSIDGDDVSLAEYEGQVVLLNVWATWCDPCVRELPELARLHTALHDKGFTVIGLNTDVRSKLGAVRTMVIHHELPYPVWVDFESKSQVAFKLRGYPTTFLIDRKGNIRWKREGEIMRNDAELMPLIEALLAE
jgi:cytochrome c biogenesis protein CcmG, thiol:disulfide interchange protein DsbE